MVLLLAPDAIQRICWPPVGPILEDMTHLGLTLSDQAQEKRLIRKSDSLSVALKSPLKAIPILTTIILAIKETRLPAAPSLSVGVATCVAMGMATYFVSVPLAKVTQARKASRDDKVYVAGLT
ncbi:hypothetical protein BHE90_010079 [Fusarium euwallaceae]|uniref:Uncharacterized protein n=1 Tax=Fusarium euwallaceae TaxID=1147111 RepID=A0A430LIA5_9HYPO|nr:hypothetical protein BHE90_010079 [Fusarium euwallaceae]